MFNPHSRTLNSEQRQATSAALCNPEVHLGALMARPDFAEISTSPDLTHLPRVALMADPRSAHRTFPCFLYGPLPSEPVILAAAKSQWAAFRRAPVPDPVSPDFLLALNVDSSADSADGRPTIGTYLHLANAGQTIPDPSLYDYLACISNHSNERLRTLVRDKLMSSHGPECSYSTITTLLQACAIAQNSETLLQILLACRRSPELFDPPHQAAIEIATRAILLADADKCIVALAELFLNDHNVAFSETRHHLSLTDEDAGPAAEAEAEGEDDPDEDEADADNAEADEDEDDDEAPAYRPAYRPAQVTARAASIKTCALFISHLLSSCQSTSRCHAALCAALHQQD